jgi:plasmid maintenance system killer protein
MVLHNGNMTRTKNGYIEHRGRPAHTVVIEKALGRKLEKDEVVHHLNGDKADNRIENLRVMKRGDHARMHRKFDGTYRNIVEKQWRLFREWMRDNDLTLREFTASVPYLTYSTVAKWSSDKAHPQRIHRATAAEIARIYPTCPLARV